ncbi:MAG: D-aminoacyl-tRNA deacylase [Candidatus Izemoplasmatales bacterium]|nr:D-aminoacyl-tRNA deacylase [Candidatus Izemoplasmatales bacterium]
MRVLLQKVKDAKVVIDEKTIAQIGRGLLAFVAFTDGDNEEKILWMTNKIAKLRIFPDQNDKMNLNVKDIGGSILAVSQFTLYGEATSGNRPSFTKALEPRSASRLYQVFLDELSRTGIIVESGVFGAHMEVGIVNDGPVTILLER